jgi:hypothetical protein
MDLTIERRVAGTEDFLVLERSIGIDVIKVYIGSDE